MSQKKKKLTDPNNPYLVTTKEHIHKTITGPAHALEEQQKQEEYVKLMPQVRTDE